MLEDCSPLALIEKSNQTSSCRGHERSFHSFILFVEVNLSIKTPLHKRYFSLGFKAKEYYSFPSRLISCVMIRLGPEDTTRIIQMRLEVLELSMSRFRVTISESEHFEGRCIYSMSVLACGTFEINFDFLSNLIKFVSLSLFYAELCIWDLAHCFAHHVMYDVASTLVIV